ncbi:UNVERIFIED_CONTAM: hypothetical protein FKN15_053775 [Acipenser sinensis]
MLSSEACAVSRPLFFTLQNHLRATASEDNAALGSLQASPQAPGQTTGVTVARLKIMADSQGPIEVLSLLSTAGQTENPKEEESQSSLHCRVHVAGPTPCENGKKCYRGSVNGKKILSIKQYTEEPSALSLLLPHDEFPPPDEFPPVLKWRRKPSTASIASSLPDILGNSTSSLSAVDASFQSDSTTQDRSLETEKVVMVEPVPELGQMEYQLLKFFILLIVLLICSSCYLAFRVSSLEHQLSFLNTNPLLPANER